MQIYTLNEDQAIYQKNLREIKWLLDKNRLINQRPCFNCKLACPCSGSNICKCMCSPDCPEAPVMLSSDGARYPVENKIVRLVYQLNILGITPTFWSCEGHEYSDSTIIRVPQVWFYSRSLIYVRLYSEFLSELFFKKRIINSWHLCVIYTRNNIDTSFSMEPDIKNISHPELQRMQEDANVIADNLIPSVISLAKRYLKRYEQR